jgi:phosphate transport system substrate-binding protein
MVCGVFTGASGKIINMKITFLGFVSFCIIAFASCNGGSGTKEETRESTSRGTIHISVDESFEPVISEELKVFHSSYPNANIIAEYKPEAECLRDFQKDSTRMIIISRSLTENEHNLYYKNLEYRPRYSRIALDAIAVVINKNSNDSVFTLKDIREMVSGKSTRKWNVAVDGNSATSTVRYLIDSVLQGGTLGNNVMGAKGSADLISYISKTPGAIGFVGISWVTNPQTKAQEEALKDVKMALIECQNCDKDVFARPSQQTIMFKQYPLVRGLHYILKENYAGLGSGFVNFLTFERGQLIFSRALLVPLKMQFNRRRTELN